MPEKVKFSDWEAVVALVFMLWPILMFGIPITEGLHKYLLFLWKSSSLFDALRFGDIILFSGAGLFYFLAQAAMQWAWNRTAFLSIESNGDWICRNPFYFKIWRIPSQLPRQIKTIFDETKNESGDSPKFCGYFFIIRDQAPAIFMKHNSYALKDGNPDFFQAFGYPNNVELHECLDGGKITEWHSWSTSGPVFNCRRSYLEHSEASKTT